jgi:hypothetical protein
MTILAAGFVPALYPGISTNDLGWAATASAGRVNNRCHRFISMVEEPTKTLKVRVHGALALFRGASCQFLVIKISKTRDPANKTRCLISP